jgi:methionyl-tRNA synthetase
MGAMPKTPEPFYVTTPIYYVNDVPHIGHAYTTLAGDVLTRWRRLFGDDVMFLTGTDEHGLKVQRAAEARGITPKELVDATATAFRDTWDLLDIRYDDFIRTTEPRHYQAVQQFLQAVYDAGDIELGTYEGLYCVSCEAYYTEDELVEGPGDDSAATGGERSAESTRRRGDDSAATGGERSAESTRNCCPIHLRPVEHVTEENYFFKLSRYEDKLLAYYAEHPEAVQPDYRLNEVLGFIRQGLRDFSMSRTSITWGVPLPWDPKHVTYVWFDALFNYCTAAGYGSDPQRFDRYWPADYHLIGKDILRFHAVYWPAMLMSAGLAPPKRVFAHGWLLVGGEKMSKTSLNQIAPADLVADFGVDGFRYHFMTDQRFGPDGDFSYEAMMQRYNADLANNFGNLANRVLNMAVNYVGGVAPEPRADGPLPDAAASAFATMSAAMERLDFSTAFGAVWDLIRAVNAYIEARRPWVLHKAGDSVATAEVLGDCLEALRIIALLSSPVIPRAAAELWRRIGMPGNPEHARLPDDATWGRLVPGATLEKGAPLFPRKEPG